SAPCEHELRYVVCARIGNSPLTAAPTLPVSTAIREAYASLRRSPQPTVRLAHAAAGTARARTSSGSAAEVGLPQPLVLEQVGSPALEHQPPGREHVPAVGDRERDVRVLLDHEDRDAGLVHLLDDLEVLLHEDRR